MEETQTNNLKEQILAVLSHPEADEGLYLSNLLEVHPEDERPKINASEAELMSALEELISEGKVHLDEAAGKVVFKS